MMVKEQRSHNSMSCCCDGPSQNVLGVFLVEEVVSLVVLIPRLNTPLSMAETIVSLVRSAPAEQSSDSVCFFLSTPADSCHKSE